MSRFQLSAVLVLLLVLGACASTPLVIPSPVPALDDPERTRQVIMMGMSRRGWQVESESTGQIVARLDLRRHVAKTAIDYDDRQIRFSYAGSQNLDCKPEGNTCSSIHHSYNRWVKMLAAEIADVATMVEIMARPTD